MFSKIDDFFHIPNDINCYWAGFLAADGCVSRSLVLEIHEKDEFHLKKMSYCLGHNGTIYHRKNRDMVSIGITSEEILTDLRNNFSIVQNKVKILQPPNITDENNIRSFIRGYIDGDGCYCSKYNLISVRGTEQMLNWIKDCLNKFADLKTKTTVLYDWGSYKLQIRGPKKYSSSLLWLFKNANNLTVLDRKYEIVKPIVGEIGHIDFIPIEPKSYNNIKSKVIIERKNGMTKKEIALKYDVSKDFVSEVLKQNNMNYLDKRRLSDREVADILKELENGATLKAIATKFGINKSTVCEIDAGATRKSLELKEKRNGKRSNER
jgi:uncharacterized protein (DUF433 family)